MNKPPYVYKATVLKVVDGDTIDCEVDVGFRMTTTQRFRLARVNCPEKFGATKKAGMDAKAFVSAAVAGRIVTVTTSKDDAFGRWIAEVEYDDEAVGPVNLSEELIANGHALPYEKRSPNRAHDAL